MVIISATERGAGRKSQVRFEWNVAGRCESPVDVEVYGRPSADHRRGAKFVTVKPGGKHSLLLNLQVPCRKCRACLKARMGMWAARAMHEVRNAKRTWFATFTLSPQGHYEMQCRAVARAEARSIPSKELTADEMFVRQSDEVASELTLFMKRIRKETGSRSMRYLLVREKHKSGLPHWHALIHETGEIPIKKKLLQDNWSWGFTKFKLMEDERAAFYVAKYLGKSNDGRVRASLRYGRASGRDTSSDIATQGSVLSEYLSECARATERKTHKNAGASQA